MIRKKIFYFLFIASVMINLGLLYNESIAKIKYKRDRLYWLPNYVKTVDYAQSKIKVLLMRSHLTEVQRYELTLWFALAKNTEGKIRNSINDFTWIDRNIYGFDITRYIKEYDKVRLQNTFLNNQVGYLKLPYVSYPSVLKKGVYVNYPSGMGGNEKYVPPAKLPQPLLRN